MKLKEKILSTDHLKFDGCHGAVLMKNGISADKTAYVSVIAPDLIRQINEDYIDCGSNMLVTSTFALTSNEKIDVSEFEELIVNAYKITDEARRNKHKENDVYIGLDIGPSALMNWSDAKRAKEITERFEKQILIAKELDFDFCIMETFANIDELKICYELARKHLDIPVLTSMTFYANGSTWFGHKLENYMDFIKEAKPDMYGINCSLDPYEMIELIRKMKSYLEDSSNLFCQPNRGRPIGSGADAVYSMTCEDYAKGVMEILEEGVRAVGGCCGADKDCMKLINW